MRLTAELHHSPVHRLLVSLTLLLVIMTGAKAQDYAPASLDDEQDDEWAYEMPDSARYMLRHNGIVCNMGLDVAVSDNRHGYAATIEVGLRLRRPRLTGGVGLAPGSRSLSQTPDGSTTITGSEGTVNVAHQIDDSRFVMPAYIFLQWEALPTRTSPTLVARGGAIVSQDNVNGAYAHIHAGCRVALERMAVQPYVGATWDAAISHTPMAAFGLAVSF